MTGKTNKQASKTLTCICLIISYESTLQRNFSDLRQNETQPVRRLTAAEFQRHVASLYGNKNSVSRVWNSFSAPSTHGAFATTLELKFFK